MRVILLLFILTLLNSCGDNDPSLPGPSPAGQEPQSILDEAPDCFANLVGDEKFNLYDKADFFYHIREINKHCQTEKEKNEIAAFLRSAAKTNQDYFSDIEMVFNLKQK